jgi:hypothetical protein
MSCAVSKGAPREREENLTAKNAEITEKSGKLTLNSQHSTLNSQPAKFRFRLRLRLMRDSRKERIGSFTAESLP